MEWACLSPKKKKNCAFVAWPIPGGTSLTSEHLDIGSDGLIHEPRMSSNFSTVNRQFNLLVMYLNILFVIPKNSLNRKGSNVINELFVAENLVR